MEVFNMSNEYFESLTQVYPTRYTRKTKIGKDKIYAIDDKVLIKTFEERTKSYVTNKMKTIIALMKERSDAYLSEINYPDGIVTLENIPIGYAMSFIKGKTLEQLLADPNTPFEEKKEYLIDLGNFLEEMKQVRKETEHKNFFLNDLHDKNIMFSKNGILQVIDVDSFVIDDNDVSPSMFLNPSSRLTKIRKYNRMQNGCMGKQIIPTDDTEIYCFSFIILNFIYGGNMAYLPKDEFEEYLSYLEMIGYNKELINVFRRLYTEKENVNPVDYIESIEDNPLSKEKEFLRYRYRHK